MGSIVFIDIVSTVQPSRDTPLEGKVYEMIIIWMGCKSCRRCLKDHKWFCGQRWNERQTESTAKSWWGQEGVKQRSVGAPKRFGAQLSSAQFSSGLQFAAPLVLAIIGAHLNGIKIALSLYLLKRFVLTRLTRDTAKRRSQRDRPQND